MIRNVLLGCMLLFGHSATAQRWESPIAITTIFEHAFSNRQYKEAYGFCNKDSIGNYDHFLQQYGSITAMRLTDMAAPADFEKLEIVELQAAGHIDDNTRGNGDYTINFRFYRKKGSGEWKLTAMSLQQEKADEPQATEAIEASVADGPASETVAAQGPVAVPKLKLMKVYTSPDKKYKLYVYTVLRDFAMPGDGGVGSRITRVVLKNAKGKKIGESNDEGAVFYDDIEVEWHKEEVDFAKARSIHLKTGKFEY